MLSGVSGLFYETDQKNLFFHFSQLVLHINEYKLKENFLCAAFQEVNNNNNNICNNIRDVSEEKDDLFFPSPPFGLTVKFC